MPADQTPDPSGGDKISFRDVKAEIRRRIERRIWGPGDLVPGEIDLAEDFGCARATVNRAMRELTEEGLLERKRKAGTRVRAMPLRQARFEIPLVRAEITAMGAAYHYALLSTQTVPAPDWLRDRLGLRAGARALHLRCLHSADGRPYQFEDRWINLQALPQAETADFALQGPNEWLVQAVPYSEVEISFLAAAATVDVAAALGIEPGEPTFTAERTTWWQSRAITHVRLSFARGYRMTTRY
ncbi:GntR family transcriptional regulator [Albidovulum sediminicola]|uniref:GntR family transcriptional regulator n=1 Tax=Albidovulum sediminicola TaxID=2984331 RepID=A0ABT2Z387_9RHOB|nr:GntR family transcriptional regulator [Defluviimonas sp. WL0075]MCV2865550.1 GntR family transcriptional regulator [Defluviimonas sp. WL0075]